MKIHYKGETEERYNRKGDGIQTGRLAKGENILGLSGQNSQIHEISDTKCEMFGLMQVDVIKVL
jgi:hypothetical protein